MPFALVLIGLMMIVTGARDTHIQFGTQLKSDLTGPNNFLQYAAAIGAVGSLGYIEGMKPISTGLLILILLSLILSNSKAGFWSKLRSELAQGPDTPKSAAPNGGNGKMPAPSDAYPGIQPFDDGDGKYSILPNFKDLLFGPNWFKP